MWNEDDEGSAGRGREDICNFNFNDDHSLGRALELYQHHPPPGSISVHILLIWELAFWSACFSYRMDNYGRQHPQR